MTRGDSMSARLRQAFAARDDGLRTGGCPDAEAIWDAVHARLAPARARTVVEHTATCPACAADWRIAMHSDQRGRADCAQPVRRSAPARWTVLAAAATILLAALVVTLSRLGDPTTGVPVYRATDRLEILSLLPADEALSRDRAVLRWSSLGQDARYDVEVGTLELSPLASGRDLEASEFAIPLEALDPVADGESIAWQVQATLSDGRRVSSGAFITRIE